MIQRIEDSKIKAVRVRRAAPQKRALLKELARKKAEREAVEEAYLADLMVDRWWGRWNRKVTISLSVAPGPGLLYCCPRHI